MRRQGEPLNECSLDLLLDTVCDTFSGILFVSMLVTVLLNLSSAEVKLMPPSEAQQAELIDLRTALEESQERMQVLQSAVDRQQQIEKTFVLPESRALAEELRRRVEERERAQAAKNSTLAHISAAQVEVNAISQELKHNAEALARAKEELSATERLLAQEIATRTRTAKLPRQRRATKIEVPFLLRDGRLTTCARLQDGQLVMDATEVVESHLDGNRFVEPKPGAGVAIDAQQPDNRSIGDRFQPFSKDLYYIAVVVWPDSFPHFAAVKDVLIRSGYEYRLLPLPEGEKAIIGAAGDSQVQ